MSARIWTGRSTRTQPRTEGPRTIPTTISRTTDGTRSLGAQPSASGTAAATAVMISRLVKDTSGTAASAGVAGMTGRGSGSEARRLEGVQPHLRDGGEGGYGVPQLVERHPGSDGDGGRMQQLLHAVTGDRHADEDTARLVDDQAGGSFPALTEDVGAGHLGGVDVDDAHRQPALVRILGGQPDRGDLRVGEGHPRYRVPAGPVAGVP